MPSQVLESALSVVRRRREMLRADAPVSILSRWEYFGIDYIVSEIEKQSYAPYSCEKMFITDIATTTTRVWEVFSLNSDGKISS